MPEGVNHQWEMSSQALRETGDQDLLVMMNLALGESWKTRKNTVLGEGLRSKQFES